MCTTSTARPSPSSSSSSSPWWFPFPLPLPGSAKAGASASEHAARTAAKRSTRLMATSISARDTLFGSPARALEDRQLARSSARYRAGLGGTPMAVQNETRKAFHELLDLLRDVDARFLSPEWLIQSPQDVVEGTRAVLHMLQ